MTSTNVLVVGAGPTGITLAIDLARRGHAIRIIERADTQFEGSRAKGIQPRSLEVFSDLGVVDDILAAGSTYPLMGFHFGPITVPWRMTGTDDASGDVPYPNTWLIPQNRTNAALYRRLAGLGVSVEHSSELIDVIQHEDHVTAVVSQAGRTHSIDANFVIGADGGRSAVRKSQGIAFEGSTDDADRIIIVDAITRGLNRNRWHVWPGLGGRFTGACPIPHSEQFQWMIRLRPDQDADLDDEHIVAEIQQRIRNRKVAITGISWKSLFRPNIRLAETYRTGRVLLAGDAAHVHTPAGAQGLNTGIQDAYNLGWKLSQVLNGAPDALLDTYEDERRPIAAHVLGLSTKKYDGMGKLDPSALKRGADEKQLGLNYRGGPLCGPTTSESTVRVGDRAPDARLLARQGGRRRLFELTHGGHFTLVTYGHMSAPTQTDTTWATLGAPLRHVYINTPDSDIDDATLSFADAAGEFVSAYGVGSGTAILIRPDGYIAAITADMESAVKFASRTMTPPLTIPSS